MTLLEQLPERSKVCLIRLRSLGDCVLTTPAIQLLSETRPDLQISLAIESPFQAIFEGNPLVASVIGGNWREVRAFKPVLCINLHGGTRSQWMTALSGARWRAGFAHHSITAAYNVRIRRAQRILGVNRTVHTAEHLASAVFAIGVPVQEVPRATLFANETAVAPEMVPHGKYAVIHPFASAPDKRWPFERFCELARYLQLWNIRPVFLAGPADDATPFKAHDIFRGNLSQVKALLSTACLFVGNDSGPAHMAAAFGVRSLVLFGASNPAIWGPWRTEAEVVVGLDGLDQVSVSRVIAALERLKILEEAHA